MHRARTQPTGGAATRALDAHQHGNRPHAASATAAVATLDPATRSDPRAGDATVFVIDEDADLRKSLLLLLQPAGFAVRTFSSAPEFLDQLSDDCFGCLVLDIRLPGMSGLQLLEELRRRGAHLPAIVLTAHADVKAAVRALKVGAFEFLEKPLGDQPLVALVQEAVARSRRVREEAAERGYARALVHALSPREREVLRLLVEGKANKEIADLLGLSTRTVEGHRGRLGEKLRVGSLAEMVRLAILAEDRSTD